jgi:hypothetical protein
MGKIVTVRFRDGWLIYFQYYLLRSAGHTQQQIMDGGNFLNYGITWENAEHAFTELSKNQTISDALAENFAFQNRLLAAAAKILSNYKHP